MYVVGDKRRVKGMELSSSVSRATGKTHTWFVWLLAVLLLTGSGVVYRVLASRWERISGSITFPVPLDADRAVGGRRRANSFEYSEGSRE